MSLQGNGIYRFGAFVADAGTRTLAASGERIALAPKTFDLLLLLLESGGRLLTKEELMRSLWPGVFVEEANVAFQVSTLRKTLGEAGGEWIVTVPKHGYRFIAEVTTVPEEVTTVSEARIQTVAAAESNWPRIGARALVAATLFAAIVIVVWTRQPKAEAPFMMLELDSGGEVQDLALSPDGHTVAFVVNRQLATRELRANQNRFWAQTENATRPFFSPDGKSVAFFAQQQLHQVSLETGARITLCAAPNDRGGTWSDDGTIRALTMFGRSMISVPGAGGKCQESPLVKDHPGNYSDLQTMPGSRVLLVGRRNGMYARMVATGEEKLLVKDATLGRYLPANKSLVFHRRGVLYGVRFDPDSLAVSGAPVVLMDGAKSDGPLRIVTFDIAGPSGTLVYALGIPRKRLISWLEPDGSIKPLLTEPLYYEHLRFSPDGMRLITSSEGKAMIHDLKQNSSSRLLPQETKQTFLSWSPDGQTIALREDLRTISVHIATAARSEVNSGVIPWSFSPDGKFLATWRMGIGESNVLLGYPVEATPAGLRYGAPKPLASLAGSPAAPAVSPDGKWLAFHSREDAEHEIFVTSFRPGQTGGQKKWQISLGGGRWPRWSAKGELFYQANGLVMATPYAVKDGVFLAGKTRPWSERRVSEMETPIYDVTPDGKRVAAALDLTETRPETHLRVLINVAEEMTRRASGAAK